MRRALFIVAAALLWVGCGDDGRPSNDAAGSADARFGADAMADGSIVDASVFPLSGFGSLSGDCNVLDAELTSADPALFASEIEFAVPYTKADLSTLSPGGRQVIEDDNAGGSSVLSEAFAFELLQRCELADLVKTENFIVYDTPGKITDLLVSVDGVKLGVSVTRAVAFPFDAPYTVADARGLLEDKLADILESTANVSAADRWQKQVLVVVAYAPEHGMSLAAAWQQVAPAMAADTLVWVMVSNGADEFLYCDGACS